MNRPRTSRLKIGQRAAGKQRSRGFTLTVGALVVLIGGIMFYIGYNAPNNIPGRSYYTITAKLSDADNIEDHDAVAVGGQTYAGQVLTSKVENHHALLQLQLSSQYGPLRSDSTVRIRLRSAVGTRFLQVIPGKHGSIIPNGGTLNALSTPSPNNLDQALDTFNAETRNRMQQFISNLGQGLNGRGVTVNEILQQAPGFVTTLGSVSAAINSHTSAMMRLISSASGTAAAFEPVRYNLANGFRPASKALQPFIDQRPSVQDTLTQAPPTLQTATADLPPIDGLLTEVTGFARAAEPTLTAAPGALIQTTRLLRVAKPGLRLANPTLHLLNRAVPPALGFLHTAQPELPRINQTIAYATPIVTYNAPRACQISDAFGGWPNYMSLGSQGENFIRFTVDQTSGPLTGASGILDNALNTPYPGPCHGSASASTGGNPLTPEQGVAQLNADGYPNRTQPIVGAK